MLIPLKKFRSVFVLGSILIMLIGLTLFTKPVARAQEASQPLDPVVGTGDGLTTAYYPNRHLYGPAVMTRLDVQVAFDLPKALLQAGVATNSAGANSFYSTFLGMPKKEEFGVRWTGEIQAQFTEPYTLYMESDGGARVWLNEQLIIDDWNSHTNRESSANIAFIAGQKYLLRVEYFQNHGSATAELSWSSPSTPKEVVPQNQLYSQPTDVDGNGLPDLWEKHYFGSIGVDTNADPDGDGLSNLQEYQQHTDPTHSQTGGMSDTFGQGDIGGNSTIGSAQSSNGVFIVSSSSADMWGNSDSFHFVYQALGTNGQIIARVLGLQATNEFAKAGIMIRESLAGRSRDAAMVVTRSNVLTYQWREQVGSVSHAPSSDQGPSPFWLKLVRHGDWVGGYYSRDNATWTLMDWMTFKNLASQVYVGLAVSAHDNSAGGLGAPALAQFDQVNIGAGDPTETMSVLQGNGDGLRGSYRNDSLLYLSGITNRVDREESFYWGHEPPLDILNPDSYGVGWSGEMEAQFTGTHTFSLNTLQEDWVRVWINEKLVIDGWRIWHPDGKMKTTMDLVAGQHYLIRVEMFNNLGHGRAELRWSNPSMSERVIPQSQLYSQPTDTDGNGLPDLWEQHYFGHIGVDPNADPDGDGLSNLQEYQNHTDPTKADTDSDGMPDGWEVANGLDPQFDDAALDYSHSGLSNLQDFLNQLSPLNTDLNGDGLPDAFEKQYLGAGTDLMPTNAVTVAVAVNGAQATNFLGGWKVDGNDIYALDRRGGLDFNLSVDNADKYVLNLVGTQNQPNPLATSFRLLLGIDGQTLGHYTLNAAYGNDGKVTLMLPYLKSGPHTLHVFWDGVVSYNSLRIKQVKLLAVSGSDADHNGIKDWADEMIQAQSGLDTTNTAISSYTSPICLEGRDPFPVMMQLTNNQTNVISPVATTDGRWYANVPLQANTQAVFQASYQNGALTEVRTLQWLPVNLLATNNQTLTIRKGDSLLFDALPAGATDGNQQLIIAGNTYTGKATKPIAYHFITNGIFTVSGTYTSTSGNTQNGSITVNVVKQNLPNVEPAAWTGMQRKLNLANLAPESVLQADARLACQLAGTNANGGTQLTLGTGANEARSLAARLETNGPVLDSTLVQGFDIWSGDQAYTKVLHVYPDGSQLIEMLIISSPVRPDVTFELQPIVSGVMFDDGTTDKILTATNFDALGQCPVRFIRPAAALTSVCNSIKAYQGNYLLGYRH